MEDRAKIPPGLPRDHPITSYWQDPPDEIADCRTTADLPNEADIVIIGAGISGATISYNLLASHPNLKVVLLEARQAASGASGRNGGHTKTATYRSFSENVKKVGEEDAKRICLLEYNTMVGVHDFAREHGIDCDARRCQTIDVFYDEVQWKAARESVALMEKLMGKDAPKHIFHDSKATADKYLSVDSLGSLEYESGSLSAYKFTIGVLKLALEKGLNLQCNTPATNISKTADGGGLWTVETARGSINAKKVVLATNAYSAHIYPRLQGVVVPLRGVVTAQRPGQNMPQTGLETTYSFIYAEGYEYMITRPAGTKFEGDIVIGGGSPAAADEGLAEYGNTDDTSYDANSAAYLEACTRRYFGAANWGSDHAEGHCRRTWSGVMGFSSDGYPFVGPVPRDGDDDNAGLFLDVSFQGHGMVLCFLCARAVARMIEGKDDAELDSWFPRVYRVTEERLRKKFAGKARATGAPEPKPES